MYVHEFSNPSDIDEDFDKLKSTYSFLDRADSLDSQDQFHFEADDPLSFDPLSFGLPIEKANPPSLVIESDHKLTVASRFGRIDSLHSPKNGRLGW
jgi:hypothetical protein